jgi:hypothetical protein
MKDLVRSLLNIGLTVGLSDRESFVKGVSEVLQDYQDDPQRAEKFAKAITDYLEQVKQNINAHNTIKGAVAELEFADQKNIGELTKAVQDLTTELRKMREKG